MMGIVMKTTDGNEYFVPYQCEYCLMTTGGLHVYNCPNNPNRKIINVDEDYDLNTTEGRP